MLMGKHTRKRYRMGDRVEVKVLAANPTQRQIDLIPASMDMPDAEPEEKPTVVKPPKKLRTPLEAGIDADLVTRGGVCFQFGVLLPDLGQGVSARH